MRKYFFLILLGIMAFASSAMAQTSLVATLSHGGEVRNFYGSRALQEAYAKADHGDVITLSSGVFQAENIKKAVTIRGAGMAVDTVSFAEPTVLVNDFHICIPDTLKQQFTLEGIYTNQSITIDSLKNGNFLKCRFNSVNVNDGAQDNVFLQCRFAENIYGGGSKSSATLQNCIIRNINGSLGSIICNHSIIFWGGTEANSSFSDCIFVSTGESGNEKSIYRNNLYITDSNLGHVSSIYNKVVKEDDPRIANLLSGYSDDNDYRLTDEAKAIIKGTDGTEVGIYGGDLPFDPIPSNPQITKFNVAKQTTADGKLSVDIEVNGQK